MHGQSLSPTPGSSPQTRCSVTYLWTSSGSGLPRSLPAHSTAVILQDGSARRQGLPPLRLDNSSSPMPTGETRAVTTAPRPRSLMTRPKPSGPIGPATTPYSPALARPALPRAVSLPESPPATGVTGPSAALILGALPFANPSAPLPATSTSMDVDYGSPLTDPPSEGNNIGASSRHEDLDAPVSM